MHYSIAYFIDELTKLFYSLAQALSIQSTYKDFAYIQAQDSKANKVIFSNIIFLLDFIRYAYNNTLYYYIDSNSDNTASSYYSYVAIVSKDFQSKHCTIKKGGIVIIVYKAVYYLDICLPRLLPLHLFPNRYPTKLNIQLNKLVLIKVDIYIPKGHIIYYIDILANYYFRETYKDLSLRL